MQFTATARLGYERLFDIMVIDPAKKAGLTLCAHTVAAGKARYEVIEKATGVPWYVIGLLHMRESNCNFNTYLGNGQTLIRRTTIVPVGRGPFPTFEAGAIDALTYNGLTAVKAWDLATVLYHLEKFNGFGYAAYGVNSPYIWAGSNHYTGGKYIADGVFSRSAVDPQPGCAPMLQILIATGIIPVLAKEVINMATDIVKNVLPTPVAGPAAAKDTGAGVTVDKNQNLATHIIAAIGAVIAMTGLTQVHNVWDLVNSSFIGGAVVSALAVMISHWNVKGTNDNTIDFVDKMLEALLRLAPKTEHVALMQTSVAEKTDDTTVSKTTVIEAYANTAATLTEAAHAPGAEAGPQPMKA